ncbi:MAG: hypothetical protein M1840_001105 [Geoglossum simile]|nr:MAG: hypothetical protein M1840_001105 [Geoglossum simile]
MPSKIQLDENLWFLYVCLQKSDFKAIDFNAVGEATGLKPPAARMRYTRLRRHIVNGTLIGTHGTPFQGGPERAAQAQGKRKKSSSMVLGEESEGSGYTRARSESHRSDGYETDSGDEQDEMPLAKRRTACNGGGQLKGERKPAPNVGKALVEEQTDPKRRLSQHNAAEPTTPIDLVSASPRPKVEEPSEVLSNAPISNAGIKPQSRTSINVYHKRSPQLH